jgi:D-3-phosphoglycerate dehydrogenase
MKPTAYIVNTARGPIIDEAALAAALDAKQNSGAALDVMTQEPPGASHPLFGRDNVIITPHTSFYSEESLVESRQGGRGSGAVLRGKRRVTVNPRPASR